MRKKLVLNLIFSLISVGAFSQSWQWAISDGCIQEETTISLCTDTNGNIYTSGYFGYGFQPVQYGVFAGDTLYLQGKTDIYIASYDQNGNDRWGKRAGSKNFGPTNETGYLYSNKVDGSLILYGRYVDTLTVDTFSLYGTSNIQELFVGKLDYNGKCSWIKKAVSLPAGGTLQSVSGDFTGRMYLSGNSTSGITLDTITLPAGGFIVRMDPDGQFIWAKRIYNSSETFQWRIKATNSGFIATGHFIETALIDTIPVVSTGLSDSFIANFDSLGAVQWVKTFGGPNLDGDNKLAIDDSGNIFCTGIFTDSIYFDTTLLTNSGKDVFLAKFDPFGNFLWARQLNSTGFTESLDMDVDASGSVYITGFFGQEATFGNYTIYSAFQDMFLARYNSQGDCLGVRHFGGARGTNVVCDQGSVVVSGTIDHRSSVVVGNTTVTSNGLTDMFVARHDEITGVGELFRQSNSSLFIYANPTVGKCTITIPDEFNNEQNLILTVMDQSGKVLREYQVEINDGKLRLNLEAEAKGIYLVRLSNGTKYYSGKIVFE